VVVALASVGVVNTLGMAVSCTGTSGDTNCACAPEIETVESACVSSVIVIIAQPPAPVLRLHATSINTQTHAHMHARNTKRDVPNADVAHTSNDIMGAPSVSALYSCWYALADVNTSVSPVLLVTSIVKPVDMVGVSSDQAYVTMRPPPCTLAVYVG
jgi:hypothetical protein